ncbi:hypothetical protein CHUAL_000143 [Chamberlinius hualienensis]
MDTWSLMTILSALYAKLLVVIGIGFITAEMITDKIPSYYYHGYFTFLYGVSIIFLTVASTCLIRNGDVFDFSLGPTHNRGPNGEGKDAGSAGGSGAGTLELDLRQGNNGTGTSSINRRRRASFIMETGMGFGSLFFRLGVLAFGLAAMIYCGLEFGSFFEIPPFSPCYLVLRGINPVLLMTFTFAQMYFIFMASRPSVAKFHVWTKFGLMHLVATNIGVWIKTIVHDSAPFLQVGLEDDQVQLQSMEEMFNASNCFRQDIMGSVVRTSAPYLCPFLIQFNLVGCAVFYIMWSSVGKPWELSVGDGRIRIPRRVDCVSAIVSLVAILTAMIQSRSIVDVGSSGGIGQDIDRPLNKLLLHVATFGSFLYSVFGILAGAMTANELQHEPSLLLAISSSLSVLQVTSQSLFLLQMSGGRWEARATLASPRPASHAITLLLISNVTLWIIATFEIQHGQVNPIQATFYGSDVWAVIQSVTLPICIFYRFQSAVMLASLWKMTCLSPSK